MAAVPIYVWNGTAWQETGPVIPASPIKYQASAPSSPSTGDIWVDSDGDVTSGSTQLQRFRFVASGGETSLSGNDANGATLAYTAGMEQVVLNGAVLVRGHDYTATNGTSITGLSPALVANDVVEVFSFMAFNVANTYTQSQVDGLLNDYMGMKLIVPSSVVNGTISSSGAVTFTSASPVSLNDVFSSTYDNYKILIRLNASSVTSNAFFRLRVSGADNTSGVYYYMANYFSASGTNVTINANNATQWNLFQTGTTAASHIDLTIFNPFIAQKTTASGTTSAANATVAFGGAWAGVWDGTTSFTND